MLTLPLASARRAGAASEKARERRRGRRPLRMALSLKLPAEEKQAPRQNSVGKGEGASASAIQRPAHLPRELRSREGLLDEREATVDSGLVHGGLLGVAGHVQRPERGCP